MQGFFRQLFPWLLSYLLCFVTHAQDGIDPSTLSLLRNVRDQIKFPKYTSDEKRLVVEQAQKLMTMYTGRDLKMERYGRQVDPMPRLNATYHQVDMMQDEDFHMNMFSVFSEYGFFLCNILHDY
jgi:hypothetical protein